MSQALDAHLNRERTHAAVSFQLDDELGTHHGISWADFVLLHALDEGGEAIADAELATRLNVRRSHLLMRLKPLEKLGLVVRTLDARHRRLAALSPAGRSLLREARQTAAAVCAEGV